MRTAAAIANTMASVCMVRDYRIVAPPPRGPPALAIRLAAL
jgi:hypothetical protein